jgi:hypothetical protein
MKRFRLLGLAFLALLTLGPIVSTTAASAEELRILPEGSGTNPLKFKIKSGKSGFEVKGGAFPNECASDTGKGEFTSKRLGTFDILFEKCLINEGILGLLLCTGLDDTAKSSSILVLGEFHLRRLLNNEPKHIVVAFLIKEVHLTCEGSINILIRIKGCMLGLITPVNALTKTAKVTLTQKGGVNTITEADTDNEKGMETCILEASEGTGAFKQMGLETTEELEGFEQGGKGVETLLMA